MAYSGKTNWQNNEIVEASDMNRIEQGITDIQDATTTHLAEKASTSVLGHVKAGDRVSIAADGTISADVQSAPVQSVAGKTGAVTLVKADVGLGNVDNVKQMPIAGGTFTGIVTANNNTSYTTKQIRNVFISTSSPSGGDNGDIWLQYT